MGNWSEGDCFAIVETSGMPWPKPDPKLMSCCGKLSVIVSFIYFLTEVCKCLPCIIFFFSVIFLVLTKSP